MSTTKNTLPKSFHAALKTAKRSNVFEVVHYDKDDPYFVMKGKCIRIYFAINDEEVIVDTVDTHGGVSLETINEEYKAACNYTNLLEGFMRLAVREFNS